ncbi:MAG: NYN domain-containing protein [Oscillospiraceae bacterium]|nr:NYN domain-containing protein [Oscillospiraceae bacterium]
MQDQDLRLAVLIDADNVPRRYIKPVMEEIAVYGNPTVKRIYGDWTTPNLAKWKDDLLENALTPIQQYGYTSGKNSTDSAMIIDAMDILYSGNTDGFCIVSSDSDFTRLAIRLREAGKKVIGLGERKTPSPFIVACDRFIYIEVLVKQAAPPSAPPAPKGGRKAQAAPQGRQHAPRRTPGASPAQDAAPPHDTAVPHDMPSQQGTGSPQDVLSPQDAASPQDTLSPQDAASPQDTGSAGGVKGKTPIPAEIIEYISLTVEDVGDDEGWAYLGEVGSLLQKKRPDFDSRNYGYKKLSSMLESCEAFEVDFRGNASNGKLIYVRVRR